MTTSALLKNVDVARIIRAALAMVFLVAGLVEHEPMALLLSAVLGLQAVFNLGCCGPTCVRPRDTLTKSANTEITYEKIQRK